MIVRHNSLLSFITFLGLFLGSVMTSPAWGHGGEDHSGDADHVSPATTASILTTGPTLSMATEDTELVVIAMDDVLWLYLDKFSTNEPITNAVVTVESSTNNNGSEASGGEELAALEIEPGTYTLQAPWLAQHGEYELIIGVQSPDIDDLLVGSLTIAKVESSAAPAGSLSLVENSWLGVPLWLLAIIGVTLIIVVWIMVKVKPSGENTLAAFILLVAVSSVPEDSFAHSGHTHGGQEPDPILAQGAGADLGKPQRLPGGDLHLPKPSQRVLAVRTKVASIDTVSVSRQLTAHVLADPNFHGLVQAGQVGRIDTSEKLLPHAGQWVERGELLTHLLPIAGRFDQGNQRAQLAELDSALSLAQKRLNRLKKLKGSVSEKTVEEARNEVQSLSARRAAVVKSLTGREALYAPISGYLGEINVTPGQIVDEQAVLFEIINPKRLLIEALAFESGPFEVESAFALDGKGSSLTLKPLGKEVRLKGHAVPLIFEVVEDNPQLSVGQAVEVYVTTKQEVTGVVLPRDSIVKGQRGQDLVWLHTDAQRFSARPVKWQRIDGARVVITAGLSGGERVVTQGATLLTQIR